LCGVLVYSSRFVLAERAGYGQESCVGYLSAAGYDVVALFAMFVSWRRVRELDKK